MYRCEALQAIAASQIIGIVRCDDAATAITTGQALVDAGLATIEIALTNPGGLAAIAALRESNPTALIGAGTVLTPAGADAAARAGAQFLLAPNLDADVVRTGHTHGLCVIPGAATVTEIINALGAGADAVKLFPASGLGPGWLRDVRAAVPQAPLIPTGGIALADVAAWVQAGAMACGIGSALTADVSPDELKQRVHTLESALADARDGAAA